MSALVVLFLAWDVRLYRYYDYSHVSLAYPEGRISVFLRGEYTDLRRFPNVSRYGSPYDLVISFDTSDAPGQQVSIRVGMFDAGSFDASGVLGQTDFKTRTACGGCSARAAYMVRGLDLPYRKIRLAGTVRYRAINRDFNVVLEPDYHSKWSSDLFDALMSI